MISNKTFSRREFGRISAACLACAVAGAKPGWDFSASSSGKITKTAFSPVAVALDVINSGKIGKVRLGYSSIGACIDVRDAHEQQLLFLCEILQVEEPTTTRSVAVPTLLGNDKNFRTLMTTLTFPSDVQIEVTSTSDSISATGCVIRGDGGSVRILADRLVVTRTDNHAA